MKKHTRIMSIVMTLMMALSLTACGEAQPEAETPPSPPPVTSERLPDDPADASTEMSPEDICLSEGHSWLDATCTNPRTCEICGETEGESLGHVWIDATYTAPSTCEICGETEGEKLLSYFEKTGLIDRLVDHSESREMVQTCLNDASKQAIVTVSVDDYRTIQSDETHEAADGYEWKILTLNMNIADENVWDYGIRLHYFWGDCFYKDSGYVDTEGSIFDENGKPTSITWEGVNYEESRIAVSESLSDWTVNEEGIHCADFTIIVSVRMPQGFDGFIFGLEDDVWEWTEGCLLDEVVTDNTLLYRLY